MKFILIVWAIWGNASVALTAEFDDLASCERAWMKLSIDAKKNRIDNPLAGGCFAKGSSKRTRAIYRGAFPMSDQFKRYNVWMRTRGGMYAQYDGAVSVWAEDDDDAIERAFRDLKRGAFPDYSRDMWKVERVERVME